MAESTAAVKLDLDNAEFIKKLKESLGVMNEVGKGESLSGAVEMFLKIGKVVGVAAAGVALFKAGLDSALEGEKLIAMERTFNALAASAGLAGDKLKNDLVKATQGLVDETDLINMANKALLTLGDQASRIPEIMTLAKKATGAFGGELADNFSNFTMAVESGNAKMLRQYGIVIDNTKALREFAKAQGMSVEMLNEEGRRQAIANAALKEAEERFSKLPTLANPVGDALKVMKNSWSDLWDTINKTSSASGNFYRDFLEGASTVAKAAKSLWTGAFVDSLEDVERKLEKVDARVEAQRQLVKQAERDAQEANMFTRSSMANYLADEQVKLAMMEEEQANLVAKQTELKNQAAEEKKTSDEGIEAAAKRRAAESAMAEKRFADLEHLKATELKFNQDVLNAHKEYLSAREMNLTRVDEVEAMQREQKLVIEDEYQQRLAVVEKKYLEENLLSDQQYNQMVEDMERTKNERIAAMEWDLQEKKIQALERYATRAQSISEGIQAGFAAEGAKAAREFNNMGERGKRVFNSIGNNAANAFIEMGKGTKTAGEAMRMFMFGAMADIAEGEGRLLMLKGIGEYNPGTIAAGAGLLALSGVLRSLSGGESKGLGGGGEGGGGGGGMNGNDTVAKPEIQEQKQKSVTVQIQGNYYETEQTRTRLMEMIRESGDFTDFNLRQIGK